ncbi:hypothetical protein KM427_17770 [Nocardioides sp. LMS-CY]|uniref:hypothetical protein n=1 Tax=Nocardioides sp. (strain LMS-CY) TaxID=2840457 RepID=UPI001BFFE180|nr:hypothetical protein [Nocardioides sp. LMS-CY]QWF20801.1 hypothetical protein KM427_17770 [Nocardioides sp. LMS-CY]
MSLHTAVSENDVLHALAALAWSAFALSLLVPASVWRGPCARLRVVMATASAAATGASLLTLAANLS